MSSSDINRASFSNEDSRKRKKMSSLFGNTASESAEDLSKAAQKFVGERSRKDPIPILRFFLAHYSAFPCVTVAVEARPNGLFHVTSALAYLKEEFGHDTSNDVVYRKYNRWAKEYVVSRRLCDLGNGTMLLLSSIVLKSDLENPNQYPADHSDDYFFTTNRIKFCHYPQQNAIVKAICDRFLKMILLKSLSSTLKLICRHPMLGYTLVSIEMKNPLIEDLALNYGPAFLDVHQTIFKALSKKDGKGLVLLHGIPGSGKTHYIRYLIEVIKEKNLVYLPPDMAKDLSKPTFLTFLLKHPNSILIIEDAENIVHDRTDLQVNSTQAVANLLNLSDGLLNDALSMQIIATFNSELSSVDQALLRPGRLIAAHAFDRLPIDNAKRLSKNLDFGDEHITTPMTLAEIYNQDPEENTLN